MLKFLRVFLVIIYIFIVAGIGQIIALLRPFNPSNLYYFARTMSFSVNILGINFKLFHKENLPPELTPCVYIANHQDNIDVLTCSKFLPKRTVSLGKKSILYVPIFGTFYALTGNILINRQDKKKAYQTLDKAQDAITKNNTSLWIMPEGTRSADTGMAPFKKGAFILAIKSQVPIIPISLSTYHNHLNYNKFKTGKVYAQIHEQVETKGLILDDVSVLKDKCYKIISEGNKQLDQMINEEV